MQVPIVNSNPSKVTTFNICFNTQAASSGKTAKGVAAVALTNPKRDVLTTKITMIRIGPITINAIQSPIE